MEWNNELFQQEDVEDSVSELGDLHKHDPFKFSKLIYKFVASVVPQISAL